MSYDAAAVARLERVYSTPQVVEQRRLLRTLLKAQPGEQGLDIGCGAGHLASELAREVAPAGRIVAIDASADSVAAAKARMSGEGLEGRVEVQEANAAALGMQAEAFDFVVASQVLCYVPDVARALAEAARVLRTGGRLLALETDWETAVWACSDAELTRRVLGARCAFQFAHHDLPQRMSALMHRAGLELREAQTFAILETRYEPGSFGASNIDNTADAGLKQGMAPHEVARWKEDLRSRAVPGGEWFFCLNRFLFLGVKI